jgi:hypothetical protein
MKLNHDQRMAQMTFATVYPLYVAKVERKGRTVAELNEVISWLTGLICGYRIEEIQNPLTQKVRYMDKIVDELAKGRAMEKILRS